jgi:hypothetical protein
MSSDPTGLLLKPLTHLLFVGFKVRTAIAMSVIREQEHRRVLQTPPRPGLLTLCRLESGDQRPSLLE